MKVRFKFLNVYKPLIVSDTRYKDVWGGRGRGGSHFATDYALYLITQPRYFRGYFVRQTFNDIKDSLFQDIKDRIDENPDLDIEDFKINEANYSLVYKPTGNKINSKGIAGDKSRTAKMKSLAGATHVFIEEADEIGESDFDQLDLSLRTKKVDRVEIIRVFNPPPKNHWIWRDYNLEDVSISINGKEYVFCKAYPKQNSDITSVWATYHSNIKYLQQSTITKFESFKISNPEYYYNQVQGLISEGAKGRIYFGWNIISNDEYLKLDYPKVYVLDFGYSNDPNAILEVKYHKDHRYFKELLYETGLDNLQLAKRMKDLGINKDDLIVADPGAGGDLRIAELRRGFQNIDGYPDLYFNNIHPTIKGQDSINFGIGKVKGCQNYMTENSRNGWNEYQNYKYGLDSNKNPTNKPVDENNHLMDCRRYFELNKGVLY